MYHHLQFHQLICRLLSVRKQELRNAAWFMLLTAAYVFMGTAPLKAQSIPSEITVSPRVNTGAVSGDADDPAIWIHPTDPAQSLVIGTDKVANYLYVWDMNGQQLQRISISNEPNNVDVRSGMVVGGEAIDICVVNAQDPSRLVVFKIDPSTRTLTNNSVGSGIPIPELKNPYGLCLYRRPSDGAMFAFGTTNGGDQQNIHQYRLLDDGTGKVTGVHVRGFGSAYIGSVMEGLVADDELGYIYAAEEDCCVHKFHADPDLNNNTQLAEFAHNDGIDPDREGLGLYACPDGTGYILLSSQGNKRVKVYRREGDPGNPHSHTLVTTIYTPDVGGTDGLDVTNMPAGPNFPYGLLAKHNSRPKNFALIAWEDIAQSYLTICPEGPASCDINADFSSDVASSCAGLPVNFTDLSTGAITSWSWDFGDGNTSTEQNPSHAYAAPGTYTVTLTASSENCGNDEVKTNYLTVGGAPTGAFVGSPLSGNAPVTVNFTDQSTGNPASWSWDFGDGGISMQQHPSHTYNTAGDYTVQLTVTNTCGTDAETKTTYIHVDPCVPPSANFSGSATSGNAPFTVNFSDQSTGSPDSWSWDFGDGGTSTQPNPSHTFTVAGDFTIQLTVTNVCGSHTETKTNYIHVDPCIPPIADFTGSPTSGNAPLTVNFTDQSTGNPSSWSWDFGDGSISTQQNPTHIYNIAGDYTVTLTVSNNCGSDGETKMNYITVNASPSGNLALNKPTSASSTYGDHSASLATDGNNSTYWRSGSVSSNTIVWLQVDLLAAYSVNHAIVSWNGKRHAERYELQYSTNGVDFFSAYADNAGNGGIDDFTFPAQTARYWRLYITQNNRSSEQVLEFELYASSSAVSKTRTEGEIADSASSELTELLEPLQSFPNPFNHSTLISYVVPEDGHVTLKIYNLAGQEVAILEDDDLEPGRHQSTFHASHLPSGIYFAILQTDNVRSVQRLLLMK